MIYEGPGWRIVTRNDFATADLLRPYMATYPGYAPLPFATVEIAGLAAFAVPEFTIISPAGGNPHIEIDTGEFAVCLLHPRRVPDVG